MKVTHRVLQASTKKKKKKVTHRVSTKEECYFHKKNGKEIVETIKIKFVFLYKFKKDTCFC